MPRIVIFGNSGSGKSTLAQEKSKRLICAHLDLDSVAWSTDQNTPTRRTLEDSKKLIAPFLANNKNWIIEGCYSDLLELVVSHCTEIIFLNPGIDICIANCKKRPWEPHKYRSPQEQDANLDMLLTWVQHYPERTDEFSLQAHRKIFDSYTGTKQEYLSNERPK